MLYLIGGIGRAGKSTLAQKLVEARSMPLVPTDAICAMLGNVAPKLGIGFDKPKRVERFEKFFYALAGNLNYAWPDAAIEGDLVRPQFMAKLDEMDIEYIACFIGLSKVTHRDLMKYDGNNPWYSQLNSTDRKYIRKVIPEHSRAVENKCADLDLQYFDMADGDYKRQQRRVLKYLVSQ